MKRLIFIFSFLALGILVFYGVKNKNSFPETPGGSISNQNNPELTTEISSKVPQTGFVSPLPNSTSRVTKKPFGIQITPATSPIQPERFSGYHAGTDFEVFPNEINQDIAVIAVCNGKLLSKRLASGYGGLVAQSCTLDDQPITVVYGHLKLESIDASVGQALSAGEMLGILGKDKSAKTDGERKHLHLSFHKGAEINILGYIESQSALSDWIDPCQYVCK